MRISADETFPDGQTVFCVKIIGGWHKAKESNCSFVCLSCRFEITQQSTDGSAEFLSRTPDRAAENTGAENGFVYAGLAGKLTA
jgi:hypothetical protein